MQTSPEVWSLVNELSASTWAFSSLCAAVEMGLLAPLAQPCRLAALSEQAGVQPGIAEGILGVLLAIGLLRREDDVFMAEPGMLQWLQSPTVAAMLRLSYGQSQQLILDARDHALAPGWRHTDPFILQSFGVTSGFAARLLSRSLFPSLAGLEERLNAPSAAFLDVGAGVAGIVIELCNCYPLLRAVALEPQEAPLVEARRNIAAAGLGERIEPRAERVEDMTDRDAFDLAWLPVVFLPDDIVTRAMRAVKAALRPGGWVFLTTADMPGADLASALARLRVVLWRGNPLAPKQCGELLEVTGFVDVQIRTNLLGPGQQVLVGRCPT